MSKNETTQGGFGRSGQKSFFSTLKDVLKKTFGRQEQTTAKATAKAVSKALAAFDEVNVLKMPTTSSGRSGGSSKQTTEEESAWVKISNGIKNVAQSVLRSVPFSNLMEIINSLPAALTDVLEPGEAMIDVFHRVVNAFADTELFGGSLQKQTDSVSKSVGQMSGAWDGARGSMEQWLKTSKNDNTSQLHQGISALADQVGTLAGRFRDCNLASGTTLAAIKEQWGQLNGWFNTNVANPLAQTINSIFSGITNSMLQAILGLSAVGNIGITGVPQLAGGAVLPANRPFLAVVGDQKNGTNVEAPLETIKQAVSEVVGGGDVSIHFTGDLAQLARVLQPVIVKENQRIGGSMIAREVL